MIRRRMMLKGSLKVIAVITCASEYDAETKKITFTATRCVPGRM